MCNHTTHHSAILRSSGAKSDSLICRAFRNSSTASSWWPGRGGPCQHVTATLQAPCQHVTATLQAPCQHVTTHVFYTTSKHMFVSTFRQIALTQLSPLESMAVHTSKKKYSIPGHAHADTHMPLPDSMLISPRRRRISASLQPFLSASLS